MTQANLFKGLSYLFNNYETQMIKRLIKKYRQLKVEESNNVLASIFAKAVFLLHEDLLREEARRQPDDNPNLKQLLEAERFKAREAVMVKGEKEIKQAVENAKSQYIDVKPTLGRQAHREADNAVAIDMAELESKKVSKMKNDELMQQLEVLDAKIYREGRVKRNMQELLDLAHSKLRDNSQNYDELFDLTVRMCKDFRKLLDYGEEHFPEVVEGLPQKDFSQLKRFEKQTNLYQKSVRLNLTR